MNALSVVVGLSLALTIATVADRTDAQEPDGKALYTAQCQMCHGEGGAGDGPAGAAMDPKPPNFADAAFQEERTDEQLTGAISEGKGTMPPYKSQLSAEDIKALVAYIRELGKSEG